MLQLFKNDIITTAARMQGSVRQKELDFYTNNFWMWGGTATVMAGFVFSQVTNPVPIGTDFYLEITYLVCVSMCLSLNLCIITWTVLFCMWGPGMAIRGNEGVRSYHIVVDYMKSETILIYYMFVVSIICFFGASCTLLWVYPSRTSCNMLSTGVLGFFLVALFFYQCRLEFQLGGTVFTHDGADGRINAFSTIEDVGDMDANVARVVRDHGPISYAPGLYTTAVAPGGLYQPLGG